jgi:hypothetical protein
MVSVLASYEYMHHQTKYQVLVEYMEYSRVQLYLVQAEGRVYRRNPKIVSLLVDGLRFTVYPHSRSLV